MAQVQLGPLVSQIAGSIAGTTFQRGASGVQVRRKPLPILRRTPRTNAQRQAIALLSRSWRSLTSVQRSAWDAQALALTWTNRFGDVIAGKGYWLYTRTNLRLLSLGSAPAPSPAPPITFAPVTSFVFDAHGSHLMEVTSVAPYPFQPGIQLQLSMSPQLSPGQDSPGSSLRFAGFVSSPPIVPFLIGALHLQLFPAPFVVGQVIWIEVLPISTTTGQVGVPTLWKSTIYP